MKTEKQQKLVGIPAFLSKIIQDKKDIKEAIKNKTSLKNLAKEKGINFAKPL